MNSTLIRFWLTCICLALATNASVAEAQNETVRIAASKSDAEIKPAIDEKHPLYIPLQAAYKSRNLLDTVEDYECEFSKQEMVGKKLLETRMTLKLREAPFSVYLKFLKANAGREVLYVQGQNNNNFLVHEAGIKSVLGTFPLSPTSTDALAENKYPITSIGLKNMLNTVIKQWENEGKYAGITVNMRVPSTLAGENCTVYEAIHEKPFKEFRFHTTRLWISNKTGYAIGVQQLAFPGKHDREPPMSEEYFYGKLKVNVKLTDADFDKSNPNYAFK